MLQKINTLDEKVTRLDKKLADYNCSTQQITELINSKYPEPRISYSTQSKPSQEDSWSIKSDEEKTRGAMPKCPIRSENTIRTNRVTKDLGEQFCCLVIPQQN